MRPAVNLGYALALCLAAGLGAGDGERPAPDPSSQRGLETDVRFLADDLLEGRATRSRGPDVATLYLANRLCAAGWAPANGDSDLKTHTVATFAPEKARFRVRLNGHDLAPSGYVLAPLLFDPRRTPLRLELVLARHGVFLPENGVDDYAGLDVAGHNSPIQ